MARRSAARDKPGKTRRSKGTAPKRRVVRKAARPADRTALIRLTGELEEAREQQAATADILQSINSSTFDLQAVLTTLVKTAAQLCAADAGHIALPKGEDYRTAAAVAMSPEMEAMVRAQSYRPGRGTAVGRALAERRVVQIADIGADPEHAVRQAAGAGYIRTILAVPLLRQGEPIGAFGLARSRVEPFTERQVALVTTFAAQAVIAIENSRLFEAEQQRTHELSESLEQQTATADVLRVISSSPGDLEPVFTAILDNATRICQAEFASLFLREGDALRVAAHHGSLNKAWDEQWRIGTLFQPDAELQAFQTLMAGRPIQALDLSKAPSYLARNPKAVNSVEVGGIRTMITVPMIKDGQAIGVITIFRTEVREFSDKQIALVTNFAAQAVIAIENARLLGELRQSLEQQTATADVLRVISSSSGDLQPVFSIMLENATRICEAKFGVLSLREDQAFRVVAMHNAPAAFMEMRRKEPTFRPSGRMGTLMEQAFSTRRAVQLADIAQHLGGGDDPLTRSFSAATEARSIILVPLVKEDGVIGSMAIFRQEVRPFDDKQTELLTNFAAQAVIAIENARLLNELRQRTNDLTKSLEDLRTAQDRLVQTEKLASLGQLTAGIAHEIKNPLNFVNNFSGLSIELIDELADGLKTVTLDDKQRAEFAEVTETLRGNLERVVQHGKRADSIVKNMLLHSREGSGERRPVDINALVEESLNLAYHGARAEKQAFNITLQRSFDPAAGEAELFPQEITRVLLNLISNGFYAATKRQAATDGDGYEPTLLASTKGFGDRVEIRIRDNGTGIPPEVKEKMFNPFFTTKPAGEGTGLGLSLSHDIVVKQHAGSIEVDSEPGAFTEIRVVLPRTAATAGNP
jgi:two-component system, NtrC family, sensor kinase